VRHRKTDPGASKWTAPRRVLSGTPAPGATLHTRAGEPWKEATDTLPRKTIGPHRTWVYRPEKASTYRLERITHFDR
jgi:hypothetical protein